MASRVSLILAALVAAGCSKKDSPPTMGGPSDASIDAAPDALVFLDAPATSVSGCTPTPGTKVSVRQIAFGCGTVGAPPFPACLAGSVTLATSPPYDSRLFAIEQAGTIRVLSPAGVLDPTPFLDISDKIVSGGEQGLLGLAFHPQFAHNGQFFVYYTATNPGAGSGGDAYVDVLARYKVDPTNPAIGDPTSGEVLLTISDPFSNHNGGMLAFGKDGDLYVGDGDGGSGGDPNRTAQNPNALLGKIMRIDVDHPANGKPYGIPAGNPFATNGSGAPEIAIMGVRNPWRFSFDRATGDLWIGEVGQADIEEVDVLAPSEILGANLGWSAYEGSTCFHGPCVTTGLTFAKLERKHADGYQAIIGGQVYRGACYPDLVGTYFFSDYAVKKLSMAKLNPDRSLTVSESPVTLAQVPASINEDATGELFITDTRGSIWHIEASAN